MMINNVKGTIIKGVGGLYTVFMEGKTYECPARGIFRKDGIKPLVGDCVMLEEVSENGKAVISEILPRKNSLIRPASANVDMIAAVVAVGHPEPDLLLLDRLIVSAEIKQIDVTLIINKADNSSEEAEKLRKEYENAVSHIVITCTKNETGKNELLSLLNGKITVLAGQSGAGKSSLTNLLCGNMIMETGDLSRKTERGKNTTRHTEMFILPENDIIDRPSFIIDSPGFSLFETENITPEILQDTYREIYTHKGNCRFQDCSHTGEPDCFVGELLKSGILPKGRYERYVYLYRELKEKERNKYK